MKRLFLQISAGVLVALIVMLAVMVLLSRIIAERQMHAVLPPMIGEVLAATQIALNRTPPERLTSLVRELAGALSYPVELVDVSEMDLPDHMRKAFSAGKPSWTPINGRVIMLIPVGDGERAVRMAPLPTLPFPRTTDFLVLVAAVLLVVAATAFMLAAPVARRLKKLEATANRIGGGDLSARTGISDKGPIGSLAVRFDAMADKMQTVMDSQRQLLQAVSHELRSPSARIRFGLEMLTSVATAEERTQRAAFIEEDLSELDALVDELLLFNRLGKEAPPPSRRPFDPAEPLFEIVRTLQPTRPELRVEVTAAFDAPCKIFGDQKLFKRAIRNLVVNAIRYAERSVDVRLSADRGAVRVDVDDDGPGVPSHERARIFEPFALLDESRSKESGGVGLGLAIVKRIIEAHGGSIEVSVSEAGGARFATTWPAATA
jgi:two-component system, OmpR family, sensor histidine kinase RstB